MNTPKLIRIYILSGGIISGSLMILAVVTLLREGKL